MPRILKKGDWGHSTFEAFADPNNTLDAKNIIITGAVCICLDSNSKIVLTHHKNGNFDLIGGKCEFILQTE